MYNQLSLFICSLIWAKLLLITANKVFLDNMLGDKMTPQRVRGLLTVEQS